MTSPRLAPVFVAANAPKPELHGILAIQLRCSLAVAVPGSAYSLEASGMSRMILFALLLSPVLAVAQDDCRPLTDATKLPVLGKLLDSAAVVTNLPAADQSGPAEVLVSVMTGATPSAVVMDSVVAKSAMGAIVLDRVLSSLRPDARNAVPAFRVRVTLGQALGVNAEPSVLCPPRPTTPPGRASFTIVSPAGPPGSVSRPPRPRDISPRIKIGVNGEVLQVDLGGGTGYADGDRAIRQSLEGQRYQPALLDGRPVQVWLRDKRVELVR